MNDFNNIYNKWLSVPKNEEAKYVESMLGMADNFEQWLTLFKLAEPKSDLELLAVQKMTKLGGSLDLWEKVVKNITYNEEALKVANDFISNTFKS